MNEPRGENQEPGAPEGEVFALPARVVNLRAGAGHAELLALAEQKALDASVFRESDPFFWMAEISNSRVDTYFTFMDTSTLANFEQDANAGVAFMNSHRGGGYFSRGELPFGQSLRGHYVGPQGNGVERTEADFYTLPGLRLNEVNSDDLIRGLRSGVVRDVSVGFYGGEFRCGICGRDMVRDWDCWHIPGLYYDPEDEEDDDRAAEGERKRRPRRKKKDDPNAVLATARIVGAHLSEVSAVYDGACPGAGIKKVTRMVEAGRVTADEVRALEAQYRVRLPGAYHVWSFAGRQAAAAPESGTARSQEKRTMTLTAEQWETVGTALALAGLRAAEGQTPEAALRELVAARSGLAVAQARLATAEQQATDLTARVEALEAEKARLAPLADDGTKYRAALIEETLAEGVRALDGFPVETNKAMLEAAPLETVKQFRAAWKAIGDAKFPGGPHAETATPNGTERKAAAVSNAAFNI